MKNKIKDCTWHILPSRCRLLLPPWLLSSSAAGAGAVVVVVVGCWCWCCSRGCQHGLLVLVWLSTSLAAAVVVDVGCCGCGCRHHWT